METKKVEKAARKVAHNSTCFLSNISKTNTGKLRGN